LFGYIQGGNTFPEPLSAEEERNCLEQMAKGDEEARNILIERIGELVYIYLSWMMNLLNILVDLVKIY
jgi:RNA polymerase sporulation-specific sigma factor